MITKKTNLSSQRLKSIALVLASGAVLSLILEVSLSFAQPINAQSLPVPAPLPSIIITETPHQELSAPKGAAYNPFTNIMLEAKAAFVFDPTLQKPIFAQNEEEALPLASLTKIMTALVARSHAQENTTLTITPDDLTTEGDTGLRPGEVWHLGNLLDMMLVISSNDAAHTISRFVGADAETPGIGGTSADRSQFITMMNARAEQMGLINTKFFNESGLDINATQNGGYGTAKEVAFMLAELYKKFPSALEVTTREHTKIISESGIVHILPNTNISIAHFPGLLGSKTGYTSLAGGNLAIIFDVGIGHPLVAVVLGSTYQGRFDDMQKIVESARASVRYQDAQTPPKSH